MQRAVALARLSLGAVSPNPAVGAVVVRDGQVVGEGRTEPPGGDHAEVAALREAGDLSQGASLFVTLEPCSRQGRTPPCTDAILASGIGQVTVGCIDPHPEQGGSGIDVLRAGGIEAALTGDKFDSLAASQLIEGYRKNLATGRPFVTLKFAMSLDGKIATRTGSSAWITGQEARARAHILRSESDAVMVGIGTVLADNPRLTARDEQGNALSRQPLRVVVDSHGRIPAESAVATDGGRTLVACTQISDDKKDRLKEVGIEVTEVSARSGSVDLTALMECLGKAGITSVLVEGGGRLAGALFDDRLIDKIAAFVAPVIIGGSDAPGPVGGSGHRRCRSGS